MTERLFDEENHKGPVYGAGFEGLLDRVTPKCADREKVLGAFHEGLTAALPIIHNQVARRMLCIGLLCSGGRDDHSVAISSMMAQVVLSRMVNAKTISIDDYLLIAGDLTSLALKYLKGQLHEGRDHTKD